MPRAHFVTLLLPMAALMPAVAAQTPPAERALTEQIVVVGSRSGPTTLSESLYPVDIVSQAQLSTTHAAGNELGEALANRVPAFSFPRQSNSVTSDHLRAARLRNMGPDQVLVLVNGHRQHPSAVVNDNTTFGKGSNAFDFNTLPMTAVKRVEVLHDGASAQYGSDAVAGVINVVLDDQPSGGEMRLGYGAHHTDVSAIGQTLTDGETFTASAHYGVPLANGGFARGGIEYRDRNNTNRAGVDRVPAFVAPPTADNLALAGQRNSRAGDPDVESVKLWANAERPLAWGTAYAFGTLASQDTLGAVLYRYPDSNQNVAALYPDGTLPRTTGDNLDLSVTGGWRFRWQDWQWDASASHGRNTFEFGVRDSLNPSLGASSPTRFDSGDFRFEQTLLELDGRRPLHWGSLTAELATGAGWRHERFRSRPGDPASYQAGDHRLDRSVRLQDGSEAQLSDLTGAPDIGAQGAKGLAPDDAGSRSRDLFSGYLELSSQLTEQLSASAAGRLEHYSDFGTTVSGKLALRHAVNEQLALRGSIANSFRAPTLSQIGWARSDNTFDAETFERIASRLVRADSPVGQALELPQLQEETALNMNVGLVAELAAGIQVTLDAFQIEVNDRITLSGNLQSDALVERVQNLPGGERVRSVSFFTNALDTRTRGVEASARWDGGFANGALTLNLSYSYARTRIQSVDAAPPRLAKLDPSLTLIESGTRNVLTSASPRHNAVLAALWENAAWQLSSHLRYFSSVVRDRGFARQRFGSEALVDIAVQRQLSDTLTLTLGADNLFDNHSDQADPALDFGGIFAYDVLSPAGSNGRFLYSRLALSF